MRTLCIAICMLISIVIDAEENGFASSLVDLTVTHRVVTNVTYLKAGGDELKLDIYGPKENIYNAKKNNVKPIPVVIFFHGGGWVWGDKGIVIFDILPYLDKGWAVVTVQYRLGETALAPAAVEDARCSVRWVKQNAVNYGLDADRIVLSGISAGGHLALAAGVLPAKSNFDSRCPTKKHKGVDIASAEKSELEVAAIVNWSGITDVKDLIEGENMKTFAVSWVGGSERRLETAKRVSPLAYVRKGLPPILTIHGKEDTIVPYDQAVRFHKMLDNAGVSNKLHTVQDGGHYYFSIEDTRRAFYIIDSFLDDHVSN